MCLNLQKLERGFQRVFRIPPSSMTCRFLLQEWVPAWLEAYDQTYATYFKDVSDQEQDRALGMVWLIHIKKAWDGFSTPSESRFMRVVQIFTLINKSTTF